MSDRPPHADDDDDIPEEVSGPEQAWGTTAILFLNLAVGLAMAWSGVPVHLAGPADVVNFGAVDPVRLWSGEVWRLFTACFVHVGAWHLGMNMWVLWQVGRVLERLVGTGRFVLLYVVSGLFGFALSVVLQPGLTAGASGAIFGITGALLAIAVVARHRTLGRFLVASLVPFVIATFAMGFLLPMVNNVAHFGGLLMGFVLGYGLAAGDTALGSLGDDGVISHTTSIRRRVLGTSALVASLVGFAVVSVAALEPRFSPRYHVIMGLRDLHTLQLRSAPDEDLRTRAANHVAAATSLAPKDGATLMLRARAAEVAGDVPEAERLASAALGRFSRGDRTAAFDAALVELGVLQPDDEMSFGDGFTVRLLCRAALDDDGQALKAPNLKNSCAWLYARSGETAVRDPKAAVLLAAQAHAEDPKTAMITHTYAVALAEGGNPEDGLAVLERLVVSGDRSLDDAFVWSERVRLSDLVRARQPSPAPPAAAPGPGVPVPAPQPVALPAPPATP